MADINSVVNTNSISNFLRIGGLATGLDTDSIVKQLMQVERIPLQKLNQKKQLLQWKQDSYRDVINTLKGFRDTYFDLISSANMLSSAAYNKFTATSSDTTAVTAVGTGSALPGTHTIDSITTLATAANTASTAPVSKGLIGSGAAALDYTGTNNFVVTLNGVAKTITLRNGAYASTANLISNGVDGIQDLVNQAFGAGKITVADAGGGVLRFTAAGSRVTLTNGASNNAIPNLGFTSGASNLVNIYDTLQNAKLAVPITFDGSNEVNFTINNTTIKVKNTETLNDLINKVNSSAAGVTMTYSEMTDRFTITAQEKGFANDIVIVNNGGNMFGAGGPININTGTYNNGTDASFSLDGVATTRNDNTFTIDGVTYTLNKAPVAGATTITLTPDPDSVVTNIKNFVTKYNEVVDKLNKYLTDKRYRDYAPLTNEQKSEMKEADITTWQDKAKSGLLNSDPLLRSIVDKMRKALSDSVTGVSGSLSSIGITTGSYLDNGKLVIDETKLRNVIQTNPTQVQNLFSKKSILDYDPDMSAANRTTRYNEEGFMYRISDILQDNLRIIRNASGQKGILIEKAGIVGDITEFSNLIDKDIKSNDQSIAALTDRLNRKEAAYYKKFTALERVVSQLSAQGSWLSQQFGGGQQ